MLMLASYGLCSPIIAEKAREVLRDVEDKMVLVVPFAGFNNESTARREIEKGLLPYGFKRENIYVCSNDAKLPQDLHIDMIYVPGGNPFKLLYELQQDGLLCWLKQLVKNGADYFGASSGADLAGEDMEYLKLVEDCDYEMKDFTGLGLIEEKVLCHVDQRDMATLQQVKCYDDRKTIFLRNDELYVID